jgi:hypothetical protein
MCGVLASKDAHNAYVHSDAEQRWNALRGGIVLDMDRLRLGNGFVLNYSDAYLEAEDCLANGLLSPGRRGELERDVGWMGEKSPERLVILALLAAGASTPEEQNMLQFRVDVARAVREQGWGFYHAVCVGRVEYERRRILRLYEATRLSVLQALPGAKPRKGTNQIDLRRLCDIPATYGIGSDRYAQSIRMVSPAGDRLWCWDAGTPWEGFVVGNPEGWKLTSEGVWSQGAKASGHLTIGVAENYRDPSF